MRVLGFEPRTSALSELRSSQLSYTRVSFGKQKSQTHVGLALSAQDKRIERHLTLQEWMEIKPMYTSTTNEKPGYCGSVNYRLNGPAVN